MSQNKLWPITELIFHGDSPEKRVAHSRTLVHPRAVARTTSMDMGETCDWEEHGKPINS
jgi:hypothetical protein